MSGLLTVQATEQDRRAAHTEQKYHKSEMVYRTCNARFMYTSRVYCQSAYLNRTKQAYMLTAHILVRINTFDFPLYINILQLLPT